MIRPFLWCCLLVASQFLAAQAPSAFADYATFLQEEIAEERIAGAVSLIVQDGKVLHQDAFGLSDREASQKMAFDQVFHLMSMTKPIITVAFMTLYEEGKFKLDDPVSKYLPEFADLKVATDISQGKATPTVPAKQPVTIRQILSHTAGFGHGLSGTPLDNDLARALYYAPQKDIASRVKTLTEIPMMSQPGERWFYSASPDVAARLIEHFSGKTVAEFLQERIFTPLDMVDTGYNMTEEQAARMPKLYKVVEGELVRDANQMPANGHTVYGGSHGLLSTAADYGKFCQMLLNGGRADGQRILKKKTLKLMTQSHIGDLPYASGETFGLGFAITTDLPEDGLSSVGRYYWSGAYSTFFFVDPANDLYAILLTQTSPFTGRYGDELRKWVYKSIGSK